MLNISIIVAMTYEGIIGNNNKLPWYISEDLKRFKLLTTNNIIIMGRKTHESIGKVLLNRTNIILTKQKDYKVPNAIVLHSLEDVLKLLKDTDEEIFIIGGSQIYNQFIPFANKLYITMINNNYIGDTYFPKYNREEFTTISEENKFDYKFITQIKKL